MKRQACALMLASALVPALIWAGGASAQTDAVQQPVPPTPATSAPPANAPSMSAPLPGAHSVAGRPLMGPPAAENDASARDPLLDPVQDSTTTPSVAVDPATYGPPQPRASHGRVAQVDWPRAPALVPHALEEAINIVTRTYPTTGSARAALRAAASDLRAARYQWLPSLSGNVAQFASERNPIPELVIQQPLLSGGRIEAGIRRAHADEDASSAQYVNTVHTLALTTTQTYFDIVRLTRREQLLIASLREHQQLTDTIDRRVRQEVSPLADLELARSRTAQVEQDLNVTHAARLTSLRIMAQLVADAHFDVGPIPYYDPAIDLAAQDALEEQSAVYSPQLRQLSAQVDAARADYDSRKAALLPQLGAEYTYDQFYHHRIGAVISASNNASQLPQVNAARIRITQAQEDRDSSEVQLRRDVASDLIQFRASRVQARVGHEVAVTAVAVSESFMRQYIAGRRQWLDVMNQLAEAVNAQIQESDAQVSTMATASRLLIESGRWRPMFDVTAP